MHILYNFLVIFFNPPVIDTAINSHVSLILHPLSIIIIFIFLFIVNTLSVFIFNCPLDDAVWSLGTVLHLLMGGMSSLHPLGPMSWTELLFTSPGPAIARHQVNVFPPVTRRRVTSSRPVSERHLSAPSAG